MIIIENFVLSCCLINPIAIKNLFLHALISWFFIVFLRLLGLLYIYFTGVYTILITLRTYFSTSR